MRVFLDTNVLVSAVATRGLCADLLQLALLEHELVVGERVLGELRRVLRQKIGLEVEKIGEVEAFLRRHGEVVRCGQRATVRLRDAADMFVLAEAIEAGADVLVSGDSDLLDAAASAPLRIVSPRGFWEIIRAEKPE